VLPPWCRAHDARRQHREILPGDFTRNADFSLPTERSSAPSASGAGEKRDFVDATRLATALLGNSIAANMFMLGYAYQQRARSRSRARPSSGDRAQRRGGADEPRGLPLGPARGHDPGGRGAGRAGRRRRPGARSLADLDETVERRVAFLTAYQNAAYAERYRRWSSGRAAEAAGRRGRTALAEAVARYLFKLMAYKDEYEVARLYTDGSFLKQVERPSRATCARVPPRAAALARKRDPETGHAAQDELRAVDDDRLRRAREA
jgi:indolepyruvate ferredoxin oxidoreductase